MFPHTGYSFETLYDDIGLIQLNDKIEFNERVQPIEFPVEKDLDRVKYETVFSGWGKLEVNINTLNIFFEMRLSLPF